MTDDMDIRGEAVPADLLAAVQLAIAAQGLTSKERAFDLIAWIMECHEPSGDRPVGVKVFMEGIRASNAAGSKIKAADFAKAVAGAGSIPARY
jgi:hypothetical protein